MQRSRRSMIDFWLNNWRIEQWNFPDMPVYGKSWNSYPQQLLRKQHVREGEISKIQETSQYCVSFDERHVKNITSLSKLEALDIEEIDYLTTKASAFDDPIWDQISHSKTDYHAIKSENLSENYIKNLVSSMIPVFSVKDILFYFCSITCFMYMVEKLLIGRK